MNSIWGLALNDMRGQAEGRTPVARAETKEALQRFLESEKVEPYEEEGPNANYPHGLDGGRPYVYQKVFRKDGLLEWFNWPLQPEPAGNHFQQIPSEEMWVNTARTEWGQRIGCLPDVS